MFAPTPQLSPVVVRSGYRKAAITRRWPTDWVNRSEEYFVHAVIELMAIRSAEAPCEQGAWNEDFRTWTRQVCGLDFDEVWRRFHRPRKEILGIADVTDAILASL